MIGGCYEAQKLMPGGVNGGRTLINGEVAQPTSAWLNKKNQNQNQKNQKMNNLAFL